MIALRLSFATITNLQPPDLNLKIRHKEASLSVRVTVLLYFKIQKISTVSDSGSLATLYYHNGFIPALLQQRNWSARKFLHECQKYQLPLLRLTFLDGCEELVSPAKPSGFRDLLPQLSMRE